MQTPPWLQNQPISRTPVRPNVNVWFSFSPPGIGERCRARTTAERVPSCKWWGSKIARRSAQFRGPICKQTICVEEKILRRSSATGNFLLLEKWRHCGWLGGIGRTAAQMSILPHTARQSHVAERDYADAKWLALILLLDVGRSADVLSRLRSFGQRPA